MNMKTFLSLLLVLITTPICLSQDINHSTSEIKDIPKSSASEKQFILAFQKKTDDSKSHYIMENQKVVVITRNEEKIKGFLQIKNSATIVVSGKEIPISSIQIIKKPNKGLRIFGAILGSITAITIPIGIGSAAVLIFEPFYASPLYLLAAKKTFNLEFKYNMYVLKSE